MQLLNGGDLPGVRQRNTLMALQALERAGCLTDQEYRVLDDAYRFLRKTEHRLQLLFDLQTHRLPEGAEELRKLALRMGYTADRPTAPRMPAPRLPRRLSRQDRADNRNPRPSAAPDLRRRDGRRRAGVRPDPRPQSRSGNDPAVLGRYPFRDVQGAYNNLVQLAQESLPFLSTRRCRHFLASIAPGLLRAVAETPDPDMACVNLEKVTGSLGAKAVLWELFSFNPPSLKLYVDLCAWSQFLSEILINNPGMIDELLDSLVLNRPRTRRRAAPGADATCAAAPSTSSRSCTASRTRSCCGSACATSWARTRSGRRPPALSDLAETILVEIAARQAGRW